MIVDEFYSEFVIHNDTLYLVKSKKTNPYDDIFDAHEDENGVVNFEVQYYNGGCGFTEAIEYALKKLK